jgi:signal transduction histidine kinase
MKSNMNEDTNRSDVRPGHQNSPAVSTVPGNIPRSAFETVRHSKVLVVDDEKSIRNSLRAFLDAAGYEATVASDVQEAQRLLGDSDFDIIVTDIVLPGSSGIDLLQAIRATAPRSIVIMMTGEPTAATAAEALRAGAIDYLTKPVGKEAILRTVGNAARVKALDDERRRLEDANQRYREDLERLVKERTGELELAVEDLKDAQGELVRHERLNALAQLAAGICHDFNNVLMPILGLADHLISYPELLDDKKEATELLGHIMSAAEDAKEIVRRMREFYKPADELEAVQVDLAALLSDVVELSKPRWETQSKNEGRTIKVGCDTGGVTNIIGNAPQLREAFMNLMLNAADAMPQGGTITLSARQQGSNVVIELSDTGTGMPVAVLKRCFEPFFSTKGREGTGMGLAMVHGIISRHNGTISINSEMGKGTSFIIHLPSDIAVKTRTMPKEPETNTKIGPLRVLVIDDEAWSRKLLAKYLRDGGDSVELAENGTEGIQKAADSVFDIVITDRAMPDMNGDQVATELKARAPNIPILLLTGDILLKGDDVSDAVDVVLEKPVTQREVVDAVHRLAAAGVVQRAT